MPRKSWTRKRMVKITNIVMEKIPLGGRTPLSLSTTLTVLKEISTICCIRRLIITQLIAHPWMFLLILDGL